MASRQGSKSKRSGSRNFKAANSPSSSTTSSSKHFLETSVDGQSSPASSLQSVASLSTFTQKVCPWILRDRKKMSQLQFDSALSGALFWYSFMGCIYEFDIFREKGLDLSNNDTKANCRSRIQMPAFTTTAFELTQMHVGVPITGIKLYFRKFFESNINLILFFLKRCISVQNSYNSWACVRESKN